MSEDTRRYEYVAGAGLDTIKTYSGEEKAWQELAQLDPADVCRRASVSYDADEGFYTVPSFGADFRVFPRDKRIATASAQGAVLLNNPEYFYGLSLVWYLVSARDIGFSGRLVNPIHIKGGQIFFRGTHILPLDLLAEKYDKDIDGFFARGAEFGGEAVAQGDAAVRLLPFPRVPVVITIWRSDEEFDARAELLFDSSCDLQIPTDVIWSIASMSVLIFL